MPKSDLHKRTLILVKKCYPQEKIKEEVFIKVGNKNLYIDIYIPKLKIAIENDGQQHFKFSEFFHADVASFNNQKKNDRLKEQYCEENSITLVRVRFDEELNVEKLRNKILNKLKERSYE